MFVNGKDGTAKAGRVTEEYLERKLSDKDWDKILNDPNYTFYFDKKTNSVKAETIEDNKRRLAAMAKPHKLRGQRQRVESFLKAERERNWVDAAVGKKDV